MAAPSVLGSKIRSLRRQRSLTQAELARRLEISSSYLNLIEHNQRPVTAPLLIKLAHEFQLDFKAFATDGDQRMAADLLEAFSDPLFDEYGINSADIREMAGGSPVLSRAILRLYHQFRSSHETSRDLASRLYTDQEGQETHDVTLPSEEVTDFVQRAGNFFPELESAANQVRRDADLEPDTQFASLVRWAARSGIKVDVGNGARRGGVLREFDAARRSLFLSDSLSPGSRTFQLATQLGLLSPHRELVDKYVSDSALSTTASRTLGRLVLANYFAAALLMPYDEFLGAARQERYDVQLLAHRYGASFEQICHRLTSLRRPGAEGIPLHLLRVDMAGNISKRFAASGIHFARFSGGCPRWNVFAAFQTPGTIRVQISRMNGADTYFCLARTVAKDEVGFHALRTVRAIGLGCRIEHARELVYADGFDLDRPETVIEVGVTCRLCDRVDCEQRVLPSLRHPMRFEENVRRPSLYAPPES